MIKRTSGQAQMLLGFLVVLAFFAQSLIPAGYMPDLKSGSVFEMVICHGAQQSVILVDENMQPVSSGDTGHHKTDHLHLAFLHPFLQSILRSSLFCLPGSSI